MKSEDSAETFAEELVPAPIRWVLASAPAATVWATGGGANADPRLGSRILRAHHRPGLQPVVTVQACVQRSTERAPAPALYWRLKFMTGEVRERR